MPYQLGWVCPYCKHSATLRDENRSSSKAVFDCGNKNGELTVSTTFIACPNPRCREFTLSVTLSQPLKHPPLGQSASRILDDWKLRPDSDAKSVPEYVPDFIAEDYLEACKIRDLSPKASATLSRRCLQGMIRDYWKVVEDNLFLEIKALEGKIDSGTWNAITAIRKIGNIGAHMEKDVNVIVDVEPEEAQLLIALLELLIKEWYVARHEKEESIRAVVELAEEKEMERKNSAAQKDA